MPSSPGSLIIDVSIDEGMGFSWARPTTFASPMFEVGDHINYYAVDHSPSYLWNSATWEISEALLPFLGTAMSGATAWEDSDTIRRAVEIRNGAIREPGHAGVPAPAAGLSPPAGCPGALTRIQAEVRVPPALHNEQRPPSALQVHLQRQLAAPGQYDGDDGSGERRDRRRPPGWPAADPGARPASRSAARRWPGRRSAP